MVNPFLSGSKILNKQWRDLRAQLTKEKTDLEHLELVVKFWINAPISAPFLDWDKPDTWPDPWELMSEMNFDVSALALGMEYTLLLSDDQRWTSDRLTLDLICTIDKSQQYLVLMIDNNYVLNFEYGVVTPLIKAKNELVLQQSYHYINKIHKLR